MDTDLQRFLSTTSPGRVNTSDKRTLSAIPWRRNHSGRRFPETAVAFDLLLSWIGHGAEGIFSTKDLWTPRQWQHATYSTIEYALEVYKKNAGEGCTRERSPKREILKKERPSFVSRVESITCPRVCPPTAANARQFTSSLIVVTIWGFQVDKRALDFKAISTKVTFVLNCIHLMIMYLDSTLN